MKDDIFYDKGLTEEEIKINTKLAKDEMTTRAQRKDCYAYIFKSGKDNHIKISYAKKQEVDRVLKISGELTLMQLLEYNADQLYNRIPASTKVIKPAVSTSSRAQQNAELYE
jgi:hypothetical protein